MKRWAVLAAVLPLLTFAGAPAPARAQTKDALVVGLVAHAPTLDPHMHFERVGVLVEHGGEQLRRLHAVGQAVMDLGDERDMPAREALHRPELPERPAAVERRADDLGHEVVELLVAARGREHRPAQNDRD